MMGPFGPLGMNERGISGSGIIHMDLDPNRRSHDAPDEVIPSSSSSSSSSSSRATARTSARVTRASSNSTNTVDLVDDEEEDENPSTQAPRDERESSLSSSSSSSSPPRRSISVSFGAPPAFICPGGMVMGMQISIGTEAEGEEDEEEDENSFHNNFLPFLFLNMIARDAREAMTRLETAAQQPQVQPRRRKATSKKVKKTTYWGCIQ